MAPTTAHIHTDLDYAQHVDDDHHVSSYPHTPICLQPESDPYHALHPDYLYDEWDLQPSPRVDPNHAPQDQGTEDNVAEDPVCSEGSQDEDDASGSSEAYTCQLVANELPVHVLLNETAQQETILEDTQVLVKPAQSSEPLKVAPIVDDTSMPTKLVGQTRCHQLDQPASMDTQAAFTSNADCGEFIPASQLPIAEKTLKCEPLPDLCMKSSASSLTSVAMLEHDFQPDISEYSAIKSLKPSVWDSGPVKGTKVMTFRPSIAHFGPVSNSNISMNTKGSPISWNDSLRSAAVTGTYLGNTTFFIIPSALIASIKPFHVICHTQLDSFGHVPPVNFHTMLSWIAMTLDFASLIACHSDGTWDPGGVAESWCSLASPKATTFA